MENKYTSWKAIKAFINEHRWTVSLVLIGILLSILIMTINFWRTLLLCLIVGVFFVVGRLMDKGGWSNVREFLDRILPKR